MTEIARIRETDLLEIEAIERASFSDPWSLEALKGFFQQSHARGWICREEACPIGYLIASSLLEEGELMRIAVIPSHQRCGIGAALIAAQIQSWKREGTRHAFLEVRKSNTVAQHLYEKTGFVSVGKRTGFYTKPTEDALIYCLEMRKER